MSKFKKTFVFAILATMLIVFLLCMLAKPETYPKIGESYANKTVEPKESFPIYNNETSYQPGDVRTLPNISSK